MAGSVRVGTFHRLDEKLTRVTVQMGFDPEGVVETVSDKLGVLDRRVKGDLKRFKEFIESEGLRDRRLAWRGTPQQPVSIPGRMSHRHAAGRGSERHGSEPLPCPSTVSYRNWSSIRRRTVATQINCSEIWSEHIDFPDRRRPQSPRPPAFAAGCTQVSK